MKNRFKLFTLFILVAACPGVYALTCGSNLVTKIDITADGRVFYTDDGPVSSGLLCNIHTTFSGVPPQVCMMWTAVATTALTKGKRIVYSTYAGTCNISWTDMDVNEFILQN